MKVFYKWGRHLVAVACGCLALLAAPVAARMCPQIHEPVCGKPMGQHQEVTFGNLCELQATNADWVRPGECHASPYAPSQALDTHLCKAQPGYAWHERLQRCVRPSVTQVVTLEVAPQRQPCMGMVPMQCMVVRSLDAGQAPGPWLPLFQGIDGFGHVPGVRHVLRLRRDQLARPPADSSSVRLTLLEVVSQTSEPVAGSSAAR